MESISACLSGMTLSAVSNKTWLNVEVTLNSWNRVECRIASAGTAVHGATQLNGNSIGIRKRLACTRVSYVNFARNTEGETYIESESQPFDYGIPAELFMPKRKGGPRQLRYRRFATAAEAIRFAVEELPAVRTLGAWMQVGDQRFDGDVIQRLYESNDYPLQRRLSD